MPAEGEMQAPHSDLPTIAADILDRLRQRRPRVHCITNAVAQNFTANMLLAAGAVPSMTIAPKEIRAFTARADALLVNLGTFDAERQKASLAAVAVANKGGIPWVLDPCSSIAQAARPLAKRC
jgi:hydroxyethylthiazole kinase